MQNSDPRPAVAGDLPDYPLIARALVATRCELMPERWHKGALAVDALGRETEPNDCASVAWCAQGILLRYVLAGSNATIRAAINLLHRTASRLSDGCHETLFAFNDDPATTFADIDRLLAAALAEASRLASLSTDGRELAPNPVMIDTDQGSQWLERVD